MATFSSQARSSTEFTTCSRMLSTIPLSEPSINVVFILGGPGSGKGTQGELLAQRYGFIHLSIGDVLRAEVAKPDSEFGAIIKENMMNGRVGPKEITVQVLKKAMEEHWRSSTVPHNFIIDGFPRKMDQAQLFEKTIILPKAVIILQCPDYILKKRLTERATSAGRFDDDDDIVMKRIETYNTATQAVVEHYEHQCKLHRIDGSESKAMVHDQLISALNRVLVVNQIQRQNNEVTA